MSYNLPAGDFIIDTSSLIAEGTFGKIFKCHRKGNEQIQYCAKFIPKPQQQGQDEERITKSEKQGFEASKKITQENVVKLYDMIDEEQYLIVIMELCDHDLSDEFRQLRNTQKWFSQEEQIDIITQILKGAKAFVDNKIIHRDIKPQNILVKKENMRKLYKLSDFGFVRKIDSLYTARNYTLAGTFSYCAPEINEGKQFNAKCDIFSYGILFYQIVTGDISRQGVDEIRNIIADKPFKFKVPLQGEKGLLLMDLIEQMIVYDVNTRIDYTKLFNHALFKQEKSEQLSAQKIFQIQEIFYRKHILCFSTVKYIDSVIKQETNTDYILIQYLMCCIGLEQIKYAFAVYHSLLFNLHFIFSKQEINVLRQLLQDYCNISQNDLKFKEQRQKIHTSYFSNFQLPQKLSTQILQTFEINVLKSLENSSIIRNQTKKVSISSLCQELIQKVSFLKNTNQFEKLKPIQNEIDKICQIEIDYFNIFNYQNIDLNKIIQI